MKPILMTLLLAAGIAVMCFLAVLALVNPFRGPHGEERGLLRHRQGFR